MWRLSLASWLVASAHAFAPASIRVGFGEKRFLAPKAFLNTALVPQELTILDRQGMSADMIPQFVVSPEQTITWNGWCMEALGEKVRVNQCTGGASQKWNWLPNGQGRDMIQLSDTNKCVNVGGAFNGSPVELKECVEAVSEVWLFGEPLPADGPSHFSLSVQMRQVMISLFALTGVGALSLSTLFWRSHREVRAAACGHARISPGMDEETGLSMVAPGNLLESQTLSRVPRQGHEEGPKNVPVGALLSAPRAPPVRLEAKEIPFDTFFLRGAKKALRKQLTEENGALDEDALAAIDALAKVNPSDPDPANDFDLWAGKSTFNTAPIIRVPNAKGGCGCHGSVVLDDASGEIRLEIAQPLDDSGSPVSLLVQGRVAATGDKTFQLQCERVALASGDEETAAIVNAALGLNLKQSEGQWVAAAPLPTLNASILYLDQDTHILRVLGEDAEGLPPFVLFLEDQ